MEHGGLTFYNRQLAYWLDYVASRGGSIKPVILVQTQCDQPKLEKPAPIPDAATSQFDYVSQQGFSAATDFKLPMLEANLAIAVDVLRDGAGPSVIGRGRAAVIDQIRAWHQEDQAREPKDRLHRVLSIDQFDSLCERVGNVTDSRQLLRYLHNIGTVFYDARLFANKIIIDQTWALDAIYTVFDRENCFTQLKYSGGRFTRSLLESLAWSEYSIDEQRLFLSMMRSCNICFVHRAADPERNIEAQYVAPDLLPDRAKVEGDLLGRWTANADEQGQLTYRPDYLHPAAIRTLISKAGDLAAEAGVYWKTGFWFYDTSADASAIVEQVAAGGIEVLRIGTQGAGRQRLLARLHKWIHRNYADLGDIDPDVTIDGAVADITGLSEGEESRTSPEAVLPAPTARIKLTTDGDTRPISGDTDEPDDGSASDLGEGRQLLSPGRALMPKEDVYVSYKHGDQTPEGLAHTTFIDQFCDRLRDAGLKVVRDVNEMSPGERVSEFMAELSAGRRIVVFLSDKYLRSSYCMNELFNIYRSSGHDSNRFLNRVYPVITDGTSIGEPDDRLPYVLHWKKRYETLKPLVDELGGSYLSEADVRDYRMIDNFAKNVSEMIQLVNDKLMPRNLDPNDPEDAEGFNTLVELISKA